MRISARFRAITLALATPFLLRSQDSKAGQAELIQALLARIDKLEKRVTELESRNGAPPRPAEPAPFAVEPPITRDVPLEREHIPISESPNLRVAGFTDFNFGATDQH